MKKLICECCGAPINPKTYKCEYCGTQYKLETDEVIRVETFHNPIKVYKSKIEIPYEGIEAMGKEHTSKYAIHHLSRNLADAIAENMELHCSNDPFSRVQKITARVRIVEPKYMF